MLASQERPSAWFTWHAGVIRPQSRVLDLACGRGRHAIAAASLGAAVTAVDADAERIAAGRRVARTLPIEWVCADLRTFPFPPRAFDVVMVFNYLDRSRMPELRGTVRPRGYLLCETFLEAQREHGWGPTSDDHLLKPGELLELVEPFEVILAREALDFVGGRPMAVASILAFRPGQ
ncbi:MAG: class I SAM-dependent methyltransferase [Gemmatimonadetes bacterium]|nr:class I SAM-dependent methyltransferase [Gemmatimonadota bacterium]